MRERRETKTVKPIKKAGLFSSQLFGPAADRNIKANALVPAEEPDTLTKTRHLFIFNLKRHVI